ncbi:MAG: hypothetical protein EAZ31_05640 [Cytophagia bacterium]|nr:MAG: hypothetical protein EAY69_06860 [Cytophagales bacterium]TAG42660.1 MAG: hypothetical protein EAZ31_05640 [Cytophagia bacterium]
MTFVWAFKKLTKRKKNKEYIMDNFMFYGLKTKLDRIIFFITNIIITDFLQKFRLLYIILNLENEPF